MRVKQTHTNIHMYITRHSEHWKTLSARQACCASASSGHALRSPAISGSNGSGLIRALPVSRTFSTRIRIWRIAACLRTYCLRGIAPTRPMCSGRCLMRYVSMYVFVYVYIYIYVVYVYGVCVLCVCEYVCFFMHAYMHACMHIHADWRDIEQYILTSLITCMNTFLQPFANIHMLFSRCVASHLASSIYCMYRSRTGQQTRDRVGYFLCK